MKKKQIHISLNVGLSFAHIRTQQDTKTGCHCFLLCVFNAFFSFFDVISFFLVHLPPHNVICAERLPLSSLLSLL